jgi:hypothetical protein
MVRKTGGNRSGSAGSHPQTVTKIFTPQRTRQFDRVGFFNHGNRPSHDSVNPAHMASGAYMLCVGVNCDDVYISRTCTPNFNCFVLHRELKLKCIINTKIFLVYKACIDQGKNRFASKLHHPHTGSRVHDSGRTVSHD